MCQWSLSPLIVFVNSDKKIHTIWLQYLFIHETLETYKLVV